jgi:magnesium transporter
VLTIHRDPAGAARKGKGRSLPGEVIWIDLVSPTEEEKEFVKDRSGVTVPSFDALREIESSSRLIVENGVIFLSTPLVAKSDTEDPFLTPAGFILTPALLITVRFTELVTFDVVVERIRRDETLGNSAGVFTALMDTLVDRGADLLERLAGELDQISRSLFRGDPNSPRHLVRSTEALRRALSTVGMIGDRLAQARDVLLGVGRIVPFVLSTGSEWIGPEFAARLQAVVTDVASLRSYEDQLSDKVQFMLDAVLGFITIEQNDLFKVLTIVSVVGIPPTIVVGIYGMNFKLMPELTWAWGYPFGLAMIALSAVIPLIWFKWRGWL